MARISKVKDENILSFTQLSTYNRCKWLWQAQWQRHIEPLMPDIRIDLGSIVHAGLASYFRQLYHIQQGGLGGIFKVEALRVAHNDIDLWADEHFPGWRELVSDLTADNTQTLEDILDSMDNSGEGVFSVSDQLALSAAPIIGRAHELLDRAIRELADKWEVLGYEGEPIVERTFIYGSIKVVVDLAVYDREIGARFIVDFKVRGKIEEPKGTDYDLQTAIYQYVLGQHGIRVDGSTIFQIRSLVPKQPNLNKNGTMSRSDVSTDWETYRQALIDNGLEPEDYADMHLKLSAKRFFMTTRTYRGVNRQAAIWREVIMPTVHDIKLARRRYKGGKIPAPRSMSNFNCSSCRFASLCTAELEQMDTTHMFGTMFKDKTTNGDSSETTPTPTGDFSLDPFATVSSRQSPT